jgi:hypothetical protein
MGALDIEFGCPGCMYDDVHVWFALNGQGLGHVRIPPKSSTIRFVSTPSLVQLRPGEKYVFEVEVEVLFEGLRESDGDSLTAIEPLNTPLYGAWPVIPFRGADLGPGGRYVFSNIDNPIIAPDTPGRYQVAWRVWQGRRFVSEPIVVEFEVMGD